jgi:uncharacterized protein (UPF0548 family)
MLTLRKPSAEKVRALLDAQGKLGFSYTAVGHTAAEPPAGYVVDHTRIRLGEGQEVFQAARAALQRWEHFCLGWVAVHDPGTPLQPGRTVAVIARVFGMWTLNVCRIVYVVDEPEKFGFAYGTLPDHAESGEERFTVEWHEKDHSVWYDILAFSRPNQLLVRLGYPLVRRLQRRFARESAAAMVRAVAHGER